MALVLEQFLTESIGDASYLVGDDSARMAAVIDPQFDTGRYLESARRHGVAIAFVVQTHVHEDFLSGAVALAHAAGMGEVCVSGHDAPAYAFAHRRVHDGDVLRLGSIALTVRHTPGHTPEHIALLVSKSDDMGSPFAVLSGGSLLADAAGRTDLLGAERLDELTHAQFETLHRFFLQLGDGVQVYPTHVRGSACGAAIGERVSTTVGHERRHNPLLRHEGEGSFRQAALADLPPRPRHYPRLKARNTDSPPASGALPAIAALPPEPFAEAIERRDGTLVDTRHMLAFGGGHVPGALNLGAAGHLAVWAGWMLKADRPLLLVLDGDERLPALTTELMRTGFERFAGYLAGGMSAWQNAGRPLRALRQMHVDELAGQLRAGSVQALDVRSPQEWNKGHVLGARHCFLPDLAARLDTLDRSRPVAVYCDSGYRASIGASLLLSRGFDVANVPGSWQAWKARGLPVEKPEER
jgi:hydroxyacylglutathione hydrolase